MFIEAWTGMFMAQPRFVTMEDMYRLLPLVRQDGGEVVSSNCSHEGDSTLGHELTGLGHRQRQAPTVAG